MEFAKIKVQNLISKRQLAMQMFGICIAGVLGLLFIPFTLKTAILMIIGIYYCFILITNYLKLDSDIDKILKEVEE